ncbi:SMAD/FHA domain-containing protein [Flagelloscypha sp. PMI_526]|nr:SMAD/FHA domain-containing protein [Flagelloscypha sp. PMI_526]
MTTIPSARSGETSKLLADHGIEEVLREKNELAENALDVDSDLGEDDDEPVGEDPFADEFWGSLQPMVSEEEEAGGTLGFDFQCSQPEQFVGRSSQQSTVVLNEPAEHISRFHAKIAWNGLRGAKGRVRITDYSRTGTWVFHKRVKQGMGYRLNDGDIITFGTHPDSGRHMYIFYFLAVDPRSKPTLEPQ